MRGLDFIDTNILVYAYDTGSPDKQHIARSILTMAVKEENGILSTQVLSEFISVLTRKINRTLSYREALDLIESIQFPRVLEVDFPMVKRAVHIADVYSISYRDGLIMSAAERGGCDRLLSEDLNNGQQYGTVTVFNPFLV